MLVQFNQVTKSYMGQPLVLDKVNLNLQRGDFLYVVGGTGAGKTSLLRLLATEETPGGGGVQLFGYNLAKVTPVMLKNIRRAIGYVPQNVRLIPDLSVYDNVALSLKLAGRPHRDKKARLQVCELLDKLGLLRIRDKDCATLSGGEAQRVAVARALVRSPELIIADEPTGAQDRDYTWSLMELFQAANHSGATVVLATHDREIVNRLRRKMALLKDGKLYVEGHA